LAARRPDAAAALHRAEPAGGPGRRPAAGAPAPLGLHAGRGPGRAKLSARLLTLFPAMTPLQLLATLGRVPPNRPQNGGGGRVHSEKGGSISQSVRSLPPSPPGPSERCQP